MGLMDFFKKRSLPLEWEFRATGVIWKIFPHENRFLIGEERNLTTKAVSFFCLDQKTGQPVWKGVTLTENWWIGIEGACGDTVFLHEYASPDMPEHKKIIAIDALTGSCRWIEEQLSFVAAHGMSVYGKKNLFEDDYLYELNITDGSLVRKIDSARNPVPPAPTVPPHAQPVYPRYAETTAELPPRWKTSVEQSGIGSKSVAGLEYLERQNFVVLSWYEKMSRDPGDVSMRLLLKILGQNGSVRYADTIEENALAVIPETFCMTGDRLIYIKERTSLRSVYLGTEE